MEFLTSLTTHFGRIARLAWLGRLLLLGLLCTALGMLAESWFENAGAAVFAFVFLWCACAISIQRLHDSGRSGWHMLAMIVPVIGPLWVSWLLIHKGDDGTNHYGPNPLTRRDYLQVDITK
jgi:uncharacterized membrane protein YhaH (DUF805 family)